MTQQLQRAPRLKLFVSFFIAYLLIISAYDLDAAKLPEGQTRSPLEQENPSSTSDTFVLDAKIIFIPGVGGMDDNALNFMSAMKSKGFDIEAQEWIRHTINKALNGRDAEAHSDAASILLQRIKTLHDKNRKVILVGHSTGTYIIAKALNTLKLESNTSDQAAQHKVALSILMAAAYASEELLFSSAEQSQHTLFLHSKKDIVLSLLISISGTNDGFHRPALGWKGPKGVSPNDNSGKSGNDTGNGTTASKTSITLLPFKPSWERSGHKGNHPDYLNTEFAQDFIGPLILNHFNI